MKRICHIVPAARWADDDAEIGRKTGDSWAKRNLRTGALERLAREHYRGPGRYDPPRCGPHGAAYYLFIAMYGNPDIPEGETGAFVEDYNPSPIREFWARLLDPDEDIDIANRGAFAKAFVAGAMAVWEVHVASDMAG